MAGSNSSMNMPGMSMGSGASHPSGAMHGMTMGAPVHGTVSLLPEWVGIVGVIVFALVAVSHLRHLAMTSGERVPWHACHVLMAVGMIFMYAPAALGLPNVPMTFWRVVFASAAVVAALWALGGGRRAPNLIWLLTAADLGVMAYMWSPGALAAGLTWVLVAYLAVEAGLWAVEAYRRVDGGASIVGWQVTSGESAAVAMSAATRTPLLGEMNISVSMIAMTIGMAYMLAAMQLIA